MAMRGCFVGALALLALIAGSCTAGGDGDQGAAAAPRLTVTVDDSFAFDPPTLTVQAGRPVVVTVQNIGNTHHDFSIRGMPATNVKKVVQGRHGHHHGADSVGHPTAKRAVTIRFTPTTAGSYAFDCSTAGHREAGMTGTLTVAEAALAGPGVFCAPPALPRGKQIAAGNGNDGRCEFAKDCIGGERVPEFTFPGKIPVLR